MAEIEIDGRHFKTGKLNAFDQIHVFRRLAPLLQGLGETFSKLPQAPRTNGSTETGIETQADAPKVTEEELWSSFGPIAKALSELSDADVNYVLFKCCGTAAMQNDAGGWVPIMPAPGRMQFDFLDMTALFQVTLAVLQENFATFFQGLQRPSSPPGVSP